MEHKNGIAPQLQHEDVQTAPQEPVKLKAIDFSVVSDQAIADLHIAISKLAAVKQDLEHRMVETVTKNESIKKRLEALEASGVIQIDHEQSKQFEQSIKTYLGLLYNITLELNEEINFFNPFFAQPRPAMVQVPEVITVDAQAFVRMSAEGMRRHAKTVSKGMLVSYSRYGFSLDSQIKQLNILEKRK